MPVIRQFLDLSTAHLKVSTREWLDGVVDKSATNRMHQESFGNPLYFGVTPTGYFIYANEQIDAAKIPEEHRYLVAILAYAQASGCAYVLIEADAPEDEALPTFDEGRGHEMPAAAVRS